MVREQVRPKHLHLFFFTIVWPCIVTDSVWIKPTYALNSNFNGITTVHVSGSLSVHHQEFLTVYRHWYILLSCDEPFATRSRMELQFLLVANGSSQLHKMYQSRCKAKNSWWWAERLPETCRVVIQIKLEFSASVGFIHTEPATCTSLPNYMFSYYTPPAIWLIEDFPVFIWTGYSLWYHAWETDVPFIFSLTLLFPGCNIHAWIHVPYIRAG